MSLVNGPVSITEARGLGGLRLLVIPGVPSPWGEAAKAILHVKRIPHTRVNRMPSDPPGALEEWTKQDSFPVAVFERERPRSGWAEILWLAERLAPEPALVPRDAEQRARFFGLCHEICGEQGLGWTRRIQFADAGLARGDAVWKWIGEKYGHRAEAAAAAPGRVRGILRALDAQLQRHGKYLMGDALSALDLYFATFMNLVSPLPPELLRMPKLFEAAAPEPDPELARILAGGLLAHRDRVYREHLELPVKL